jgi:nitrite reductase/ring-hydroxylating ferredoxin subunit
VSDVPMPPQRLTETRAGIALGPLDLIADGAARNYVLEIGERRFHGFVVRQGNDVRGYVDRCPHMGVPLAQVLDGYLTADGGLIQCAWHGALFRIDDGLCVGGPCTGASLREWPVTVCDGGIVTA